MQRLSPIRHSFQEATPASVKADALAGLTNATIVLPQGVAFAIIAGLPPEYGLFTAIIVTIVAAIWGSSRVMVSGPTTAISAVLFAALIVDVRIEGPLFFASIAHVAQEFRRVEERDGLKTCALNLKGVSKIDLAGADFILAEARRARRFGHDLQVIAANPSVLNVLKRLHCHEVLGPDNVHAHQSEAIGHAVVQASDQICTNCQIRCFDECVSKPSAPT